MKPIPLDPAGYHGTYKLVGGQSSLDLVNTLAWPGTNREHDWLDPPSNLTLWASEIGLIDGETRRRLDEALRADPEKGRSDLTGVRRIRDVLRSALTPMATGGKASPQAIEQLDTLLGAICARRRIDPAALRWSWVTPTNLEEMLAPVIWNAGEVLTGIDSKRLARCPSCDWLFHDTTRNRSRRWCDMADCWSRDKALR
ncbi:MAG: CGNR zinc finger domain-containing protein, partial [Acidimicrobiia bacterium]